MCWDLEKYNYIDSYQLFDVLVLKGSVEIVVHV